MKKKLIFSLSLLFLLFLIGAVLTMIYTYRATRNLELVIKLHRIEIIRQNFVINIQVVQSNLYTTGTIFGKELDDIVNNVSAMDDSIGSCLGCHHSADMTKRLEEVHGIVQQYKEAISYLVTSTANEERIERLKFVAVGIGDSLLEKTHEMASIADKSLSARTSKAIGEIGNTRKILIVTLITTMFIALGIAVVLTRQMTRPLNELVKASRMIASGALGYTTSFESDAEFGEVASSFNAMSLALQAEHEKTSHYIEQLSGLYKLTLSSYMLSDARDMQAICAEMSEMLRVGQCIVLLHNDLLNMFVPYASARDLTEEAAYHLRYSTSELEEFYRLSGGDSVVLNEGPKDGLSLSLMPEALNEKTLMVSWLYRKNRLLGAVRVSDKDGLFTDEDGKILTILANHIAVAMENAALYSDLHDKIVELKDTQEQLIQSAKLAAIGELASNVAHEINNPLTSILGFTEMAREDTDMENIRRSLIVIEQESLRARDIVKQLLGFARKRPLKLSEVDINEVLKEIIPLVTSQAKTNRIVLSERYGELPRTVADPDQMKQVFINCINNAISAMPAGGTLTISTSYVEDHVVIEFRDTGTGISREVLGRIFEPFFTTKKDAGTGLGLPISYRIMQAHGGRIDVESVVGQGSVFRVRIPLKVHAPVA
jgi:signal transduction histidine kinase/HAMP domain-containing protein